MQSYSISSDLDIFIEILQEFINNIIFQVYLFLSLGLIIKNACDVSTFTGRDHYN